jgi:hypothetical protein
MSYITWNDGMILDDKFEGMWKAVAVACRNISSQSLPGRIEENYETLDRMAYLGATRPPLFTCKTTR